MKIINDPVYGFIPIEDEILLKLIEHPYVQRLRRIKQLGVSDLVYPGAVHTRFQHALGAYHLISTALDVLVKKGHTITDEEKLGAKAAILLHDMGHVPLSHVLEKVIIPGVSHEKITLLIMEKLNELFNGRLSCAIEIFKNTYPKKYLCQLISSQLDVDRLDYLNRDSFFCGVPEGNIGTDRIIKMMDVQDNLLVINYKGIYSVEKFLIARRFMYWQVYFHKTSMAAEKLLLSIFNRVKDLLSQDKKIPLPNHLTYFFRSSYPLHNVDKFLENFMYLDDTDIFSLLKEWKNFREPILADLTERFLDRRLFKTEIYNKKPTKDFVDELKNSIQQKLCLKDTELPYYFHEGSVSTKSYNLSGDQINILFKDKQTKNISAISPLIDTPKLLHVDYKYFISYPKECLNYTKQPSK